MNFGFLKASPGQTQRHHYLRWANYNMTEIQSNIGGNRSSYTVRSYYFSFYRILTYSNLSHFDDDLCYLFMTTIYIVTKQHFKDNNMLYKMTYFRQFWTRFLSYYSAPTANNGASMSGQVKLLRTQNSSAHSVNGLKYF